MKNVKRIMLIACYFGELPWYTDFFVHSCGFNSSIDFTIITDNIYNSPLPENVKLLKMTREEFEKLASSQLSLKIEFQDSYKLCDFKPAYGLILSSLIDGYDFWGHCDIDIILGDIRAFITDNILDKYDLISVRADWLTGCFLIYRNTDRVNTLFRQSKDYEKVFTSTKHYCFDETNFRHRDFSSGKNYFEVDSEIESMMHVVQKMESKEYIKCHFDHFIIEGRPGKLNWENGKLFYKNEFEVLLYHMIHFKNHCKKKKINMPPKKFNISAQNLYNLKFY